MMPSQKIDLAKSAMTVTSKKSRTPSDLLHRALAHINYRVFKVDELRIFEDPAIAVLHMLPLSEETPRSPEKWKKLRDRFFNTKKGIILSVKISSHSDTKQKFIIYYVVEKSDQKIKQSEIEASDNFIKEMFNAIPDVSLCEAAI